MTMKIINGITFPLQIPLHFSKQVLIREVFTSFRGGAGGPQQLPGLCLLSRTSLPLGFCHFLAVPPQAVNHNRPRRSSNTKPFFSTTSKAIKALPFTLPFWGHADCPKETGGKWHLYKCNFFFSDTAFYPCIRSFDKFSVSWSFTGCGRRIHHSQWVSHSQTRGADRKWERGSTQVCFSLTDFLFSNRTTDGLGWKWPYR